jgi:hypothetical protein
MTDTFGASLFRYWQERRDADGEPLSWPGGPGGFPYRGNPRTFTKEEWETLQLAYKFRYKTFYLNDEEDGKQYQDVCERVANGYFLMRDRERQWDPERQCFRIYLEWLEPGYVAPPSNEMPLPTEGQTYAINGPLSTDRQSVLGGVDLPDSALYSKLAGVVPGLQLEQTRRR